MRTAVLLLALATSVAAAQEMDPQSELHDRVPGPPVSCVDQDRVGVPLVFNPTAILFRQSGARVWRNTPEASCQALRWGAHLVMFNTGRLPRRPLPGDPARFDHSVGHLLPGAVRSLRQDAFVMRRPRRPAAPRVTAHSG